MDEADMMRTIEAAAEVVRRRLITPPQYGLILGSGLGRLADAVVAEAVIPYGEIPHFPRSTVEGHVGRFVAGKLEGQPVLVMQGRAHYYEGYSMAELALPLRVMQTLGIHTLILTNAAGGLNPSFRPGDVMIIRDQINLVGMTGLNPLIGPNLSRFGPRFVDMTQAYDPDLRAIARQVAARQAIPCHEGVYVALSGPCFETPAEVRFLRVIGADAVGMSTGSEVAVARHGGMRVLGLSGISNVAAPPDVEPVGETTHEEVLEAGRLLVPRLETIIRGVLKHP